MENQTADNVIEGSSYRLSATFTKLVAALLCVQRDARHISKDSDGIVDGKMYRYPSLAAVLDAVKPKLCEHNILVLQPTRVEGSKVTVTTLLMLEDEYIESSLTLSAKEATPQSVGSALTYARRYGLVSLLCMATEDDDGFAGSFQLPGNQAATQPGKGKADTKPKAETKQKETKQDVPPPAKVEVKSEPVKEQSNDASPQGQSGSDSASVAQETVVPPVSTGASEPAAPVAAPSEPVAAQPAEHVPAAAEVRHPSLPGAPAEMTDTEASVIIRLRDAVVAGQCPMDRAKVSLSEGGLSFRQLSPAALAYARTLILREPAAAVMDVGF